MRLHAPIALLLLALSPACHDESVRTTTFALPTASPTTTPRTDSDTDTPSEETVEPPATDARDSAFSSAMLDVVATIRHAVRGEPYDATLACPSSGTMLLSPPNSNKLSSFGKDFETRFSGIDARLFARGRRGWIELRALALVQRDGSLRWLPRAKEQSDGDDRGAPLAQLEPAWRGGFERLIESLSPAVCAPERPTDQELRALGMPAEMTDKLRDTLEEGANIEKSCALVGSVTGSWSVRLKEIGAIIAGNGRVGAIAANAAFNGGRVCISSPEVDTLEGASHTPPPPPPPPPVNPPPPTP
jgi:hypothetical protein